MSQINRETKSKESCKLSNRVQFPVSRMLIHMKVLKLSDGNEQFSDHKFLPVKRQINEYMIFVYEGSYFPGKITHTTKKEATITSMKRCGRLWQWPEKPDILTYKWRDVVSHICEPLKTSKTRNVYSVSELDFLWG